MRWVSRPFGRVSGFREALQGRAGLEVLDTVYDNGERDLSDSVMRLLNKNEDLAGIFCTNGEMRILSWSV